jgi:hypothetical protein
VAQVRRQDLGVLRVRAQAMWELMQADRRARDVPRPVTPPLLALPDAVLEGSGGRELCAVCARAAVDAHDRWTWLACTPCLLVDAAAARLLGRQRLLPLGRHPTMNTGCTQWDGLAAWRSAEVLRTAAAAGLPASGRVLWEQWPAPGPDPVATSAAAYGRLVRACLPQLIAAHELLGDAAGLAVRARQHAVGAGGR